jgi:hypothetical protein
MEGRCGEGSCVALLSSANTDGKDNLLTSPLSSNGDWLHSWTYLTIIFTMAQNNYINEIGGYISFGVWFGNNWFGPAPTLALVEV